MSNVNTRQAALSHVLDVMSIPTETKKLLIDNAIRSISVLATCSNEDFETLRKANPDVMLFGHVKSMLLFKKWCKNHTEENPSINLIEMDWLNMFVEDKWDEFMMNDGLTNIAITKQVPQSIQQPTLTTPSATTPSLTDVSSRPLVKLDIRSYPMFDGKLNHWKAFKQQFRALATIHGFNYLLEKTYRAPTDVDSPSYLIYLQHNSFLQSILEFSLAKSTALSRVKRFSDLKDGKEAWKSLDIWYEGQGSQETMVRKALEVISTHKLTSNSHGGADVYMEKFENALQDLDQIGQSYNLKMAKINFLNNITDDAYLVVKDSLEMDSDKSYHDALIEIRRKSISVEANRSNNVRRSNKSTKKRNHDKDTRKVNIVHSKDWIPKEKWMKMSREERQEHLKKKKKNKKEKEDVPKSLPSQYSNANLMTSKEKELYGIANNTNTPLGGPLQVGQPLAI